MEIAMTSVPCRSMQKEALPKHQLTLGRRGLATAFGMVFSSFVGLRRAKAQTFVAVQNVLNFGADPTGNNDSAPALQAAFNALTANGGTVYIPDGDYKLQSPVVFSGKPVVVEGNGEQATRLFTTHGGVGLSFQQSSPLFMSSVRNLGISSVNTEAECAISIVYPPFSVYGSQTALIENVAAPSQLYASYPNFLGGLRLRGCWQSAITNFKHQAPGSTGPITGSFFIDIGGRSIDVRITNCTGTNSDLGLYLSSYTEGIHLKESAIVSSNYGVSMPALVFDSFESSKQFSSLGMTISGCELSCHHRPLELNRVLSAYISDTHFGLLNSLPSVQIIAVIDSQDVKIVNSTVSGQNSEQIGILFQKVTYPCQLNQSNDNFFVNVAYPIVYGAGVTGNTATGTRFGNSGSTLSNLPVFVDLSGNTTNNCEWLNSHGQPVWER